MEDFPTHQRTSILLMKTGGLLSMAASHFIMRDVLIRYHRGERVRLTHKVVFALSLADFWGSFFSPFMSTWMVPTESGDYQAAGTTASCTAQGFFESYFYGLSVALNAILAAIYCNIVKRGKKDESRSRHSLCLILGLPPILCLLLAIMPLFDKAYNYTDFHSCSVAEHPLGCLSENNDYACTRGSNAREIKIARFACVCLANVVIVVSVCVLINHVMHRERRMTTLGAMENVNEMSNKVTWQGICYVAAFFFSWVPWYVWQWIRITSGMKTMATVDSPVLVYVISITYPLQGVMNALVFFRPQYRKFRQRDSDEWRLASALRALSLTVPKILTIDWWQSLKPNASDEDSM